ncbi:Uncharacterized protein APZ42_031568 [Daphnia magna]|uniref:Uncharacterized protein n=1 Tax=Daphnia magna TaxID=35525 RepID=A0A164MRG0_9CRUS|nr:Uncharacterized protein APZ42_031568 [Daphnia magna]
MIQIFKKEVPHPTILQVHAGITRLSNIIPEGLGKFAKSFLSKEVQLRFYSVEIDESTDLNTTNKMAVMLLYWDSYF